MSKPPEAATAAAAASSASPRVRSGLVELLFAYDIGHSIDIDQCKALIGEKSQPVYLQHSYRAPIYFQFAPPPLRILNVVAPVRVGNHATSEAMEICLFGFGALSISYKILLAGESLDDLIELSCAATDCQELRDDSLAQARKIIASLARAIQKPKIAPIVEDYLIFQVRVLDPPVTSVPELISAWGAKFAQILRAERIPLSTQEIADSLARSASYGTDDLTLVDWNATMIIDNDLDDCSAVVEFANVQLMEMRFLDSQLDDSLDQSYETVSRTVKFWRVASLLAALRKIGRLQIDSAILFERVHNSLKLLGDPYLARIYRLASDRFKFQEWNTTILRKIDAIKSIYGQLHERVATQRLEILEWIVIILIGVSILLPFLMKLPH